MRKTHDYSVFDLPFDAQDIGIELIDVSALRIYFNSRKYDIGSLVYTDRKPAPKTKRAIRYNYSSHSRYTVNTNTYKKSRKEPLINFVEYLFIEAKKGLSYQSLESKAINTMRFMLWCDAHGYELCLDNITHAREAFRAYINHLEHQNKIYDPSKKIGLSRSTVSCYQNMIKMFLAVSLNIRVVELVVGLRLIQKERNSGNSTFAPDHETLGKNLALWSCLFHNITDFLLKEKQYPFELSLPEEKVWVFSSQNPFTTKCQKKIRKVILMGIDDTTGKIRERDELKTLNGYTTGEANALIRYSQRKLNEANNDLRHCQRYRLGKIAHDAFFMMFMLFTRTRTEIRHIKLTADISIEPAERVGFKIIKARANGKACEYHVAAKFIKIFKQYLKLRQWLLNGQRFEYLFLNISSDRKVIKSNSAIASVFNQQVICSLVDTNFPTITPSQCRVAAADYILNKYDVATAAIMLQNRQSTLVKHYANGNPQRTSQQLTSYFSKLSQKIISIKNKKPSHAEVPAGHCTQLDKPKAESDAPIQVNCHTPQGCLYCEHFAVHADKIDIRKLLSLEYIIKETKTLAHSIEHFESINGGLLIRIDALLKEIAQLNEFTQSSVTIIRKEVYEEEKLSHYWNNKLNQLVNMGVI